MKWTWQRSYCLSKYKQPFLGCAWAF